jgi:DNA-binding MarR family transcriptional regulator
MVSVTIIIEVTASQVTASDRATEIIDALAPLLAHHRRSWAARCQAHGLSMIGFQVIALLEMNGALPMTRLADEIGVALPNATGIVGRLQERGIVERTRDAADRRLVLVGLTDQGRRLIGEMEAVRLERMTRLIATLNAVQQDRLLETVHDLRIAATRLHDQADTPQEHGTA